MSAPTVPHVTAMYRYPVKGLSPEPLESVAVTAGETLPYDRAYAIENGPGRFDPLAPRHLPKINFLMLMRDERLATLETSFDDDTQTLTVMRAGKQVATGALTTPVGRSLLEQFFSAYMKESLRGAPKIVSAAGHSFSDVADRCIHIVNLASVRDLSHALGRKLDPLRFRANVYIDGVAPWQELDWLGKTLQIGKLPMRVFKRTVRCDATNVDPETGIRDLALPAAILRLKGHSDFGVYATIGESGTLNVGDPVTI